MNEETKRFEALRTIPPIKDKNGYIISPEIGKEHPNKDGFQSEGYILTGKIKLGNIGVDKAVLASAIWEGTKQMHEEARKKETTSAKRKYLIEKIKESMTYHYMVLGLNEIESYEMAENYIDSLRFLPLI